VQPAAFNHVAIRVTDLARSQRFYEQVFGFRQVLELEPPDEMSSQLLGLDPPLGMTARYFERDGVILELLHFAAHQGRPAPRRGMDEPGLTHLSFGVDDLAGALAAVEEHGGEVLPDTNIGVGVFVRDPDGQLLELLTSWEKPA